MAVVIVVADTSPLSYLVHIDEAELLPKLFGEVLIPTAVLRELRDERSPSKVRLWAENLPNWVTVRHLDPAPELDSNLMKLDPGEREAIALALKLDIDR